MNVSHGRLMPSTSRPGRRGITLLACAGALTLGVTTLAMPAAAQSIPPEGSASPVTFSDDFERANGPVGNGWDDTDRPWEVADGIARPVAGGGPTPFPEAPILTQPDIALGNAFTVAADVLVPVEEGRAWGGVALNVSTAEDGSQDAYVLRVARGSADPQGFWQLVRITGSAESTALQLVDSGFAPFEQGDVIELETTGVEANGFLSFSIGTSESLFVQHRSNLFVDDENTPEVEAPLFGGSFGLYASETSAHDNVSVETTTAPAIAPTPPQPLECVPVAGSDYELLTTADQVVDTIPVADTWAGHQVGQQMITEGDDQYVAYYDGDRVMTVAHRTLDSREWTYQTLDSTLGWDSHNFVTLALDPSGQLHVTGNMHGVPMNYWRTSTAGDITTLERRAPLVDADLEQSVTYPTFFTSPEGELLLTFRDGGSGDGANYYYRYDAAAEEWSLLLDSPLFDGEGERNSYARGPALGPDGYYWVSWVWRDTPDAATNSRLSFMRSPDLQNWETLGGDPLTLPLQYDQPGVVIDDVPIYEGLLNGLHQIGFDADGEVMAYYHKYDEERNSQLYVARPAGGDEWETTQVTEWTGVWDFGGGGSLGPGVGLGAPSVLPDDRLQFPFTCNSASRSMILDNDTLEPVAEVDTPSTNPAEVLEPKSDYPGIAVQLGGGGGSSEEGRYLLRWESMPSNLDRPREEYPEPQPLEVYVLSAAAAEEPGTPDPGTPVDPGTLADPAPGDPTDPGSGTVGDIDDELAATGSDPMLWVLLSSLLLVAGGVVMVGARRRLTD